MIWRFLYIMKVTMEGIMSNNYLQKFYDLIDDNPELLSQFIQAADAAPAPTRSMPTETQSNTSSFVRQVAGGRMSDAEIAEIEAELADNKIVQLYEAADGALDAQELLEYVGGLSGTKGEHADSAPVRALFDGKLDLKEILMIIMLLKLFKKKQTNTYNYGGNTGLFGSLFGNQQQSYNGGLFSNLFGSNQYNYNNNPLGLFSNMFGVQQPQQPSLFGSLFGTNTNQYNNNPLGALFGMNTSPAPSNGLMDVLGQFVNGGYNNNQQALQLYNLLGNASQNAFNTNGTINVSSLFSLLGNLMR